jgi:AGZA family xanthine/uracil permease-like MFS transporter
MPVTFSIADGIAFGMMSYVIIKLAAGKAKEISLATYIISALFIVKFFI